MSSFGMETLNENDIKFELKWVLYGIVMQLKTRNEEEAKIIFKRVYELVKYHCNAKIVKEKEEINTLLVLSDTGNIGNINTRAFEKKKGKPIIVIGDKVSFHIHILVLGEGAREFARDIVKKFNKKARKEAIKMGGNPKVLPANKQKIISIQSEYEKNYYDDKGREMIGYCLRQAKRKLQFPRVEDGGYKWGLLEDGVLSTKWG